MPTDYTYTGQYSNVADFGLMYYNARWYGPTIARFAQADTIVPEGAQGWDRYAYANNNPVRYSDPSGHCIWDLCIVEGIGLVEVVALVSSAYIVADYYAHTPMPAALADALDQVEEQVRSLIPKPDDNTRMEMRGEYKPPILSGAQEEAAYREALHIYKQKIWGIPPNVDVPPDVLDGIARDIKEGKKPIDAAERAPGPPEGDDDRSVKQKRE